MKKAIATDRAPQAIGPYSQAIQAGNLLFISGQIPVNPEDGTIISHNIEKQTHQVLKNIEAILTEAGYSLSDVVKTTVFLKDMSDFETVNTIYGQYFKHPFPARCAVEVGRLPKDVKVEIEAIAYKSE